MRIKDKYFIYSYIVLLLVGIAYIVNKGLQIEQSWKIVLDLTFRACLFIINILVPFIIYQHFMIGIFTNHQRIISQRPYIWKSRKIIFRDRRKYFILYVIFSLYIAIASLTMFTTTEIDEVVFFLLFGLSTISFFLVMTSLISKNFIQSINKKIKNFKVYDKDYKANIDMKKETTTLINNYIQNTNSVDNSSITNITNNTSIVNNNKTTNTFNYEDTTNNINNDNSVNTVNQNLEITTNTTCNDNSVKINRPNNSVTKNHSSVDNSTVNNVNNSQTTHCSGKERHTMETITIDDTDVLTLTEIEVIYDCCNKKVFKCTSKEVLYNLFNVKNLDYQIVQKHFKITQKIRFLSLICLLQDTLVKDKEWDKKILNFLEIDYTEEYMKSRNKYMDDDTLKSSEMDLKAKISHIIDTKAS